METSLSLCTQDKLLCLCVYCLEIVVEGLVSMLREESILCWCGTCKLIKKNQQICEKDAMQIYMYMFIRICIYYVEARSGCHTTVRIGLQASQELIKCQLDLHVTHFTNFFILPHNFHPIFHSKSD